MTARRTGMLKGYLFLQAAINMLPLRLPIPPVLLTGLLVLAVTVLPLNASPAESAPAGAVISDQVYTHADRLVAIDGKRRLNLYCTGSGSPTVLFDAGLGDGTKAWGLVQPAISHHTRACAYDRAGLGFSDPADRPGNSANAVDDLHRLLQAAGVSPPYVLVGHSYAGMNIKLFAETYRKEVIGMVYVDPTHEDLGQRLWALEPGIDEKFKTWLVTLQTCKTASVEQLKSAPDVKALCLFPPAPVYSPAIADAELKLSQTSAHQQAWVSEMENIYFDSATQLRRAKTDLGDLPLIVLMKEPIAPLASETQQLRDAKNQVWLTLLTEMADQSRCGKLIVVKKTGHYIELEQSGVVTNAIVAVVNADGVCDGFKFSEAH